MSDTFSRNFFGTLNKALGNFFPPPDFLASPGTGLDISSRSVKAVTLGRSSTGLSLVQHAKIDIPEGVIQDGDIAEPDALVEILRRLRSKHGLSRVHASLPEKKAFLYQAAMPRVHDRAALRQAIESELEEHVPLPPAETYFDFEVAAAGASLVVPVAVTAYARRIVDAYALVLERAGLTPLSLEVESQALARSVVPHNEKRTVMAVDFGRYATRVAIVSEGSVVFTATIDIGGHALSLAIMKQKNVEEEEAEKLKNERGLIQSTDASNLIEALMITVTVLKDELVRHVAYWNDRTAGTAPVAHLFLCGGNANLRGLPEYLAAAMRMPVSVANVWTNAFSLDLHVPDMHKSESLGYATAVGLALRSFKN